MGGAWDVAPPYPGLDTGKSSCASFPSVSIDASPNTPLFLSLRLGTEDPTNGPIAPPRPPPFPPPPAPFLLSPLICPITPYIYVGSSPPTTLVHLIPSTCLHGFPPPISTFFPTPAAPFPLPHPSLPLPSPFLSPRSWIEGTWDLSRFQKNGETDWDAVLDVEIDRRALLERTPLACRNEDVVNFDTGSIPWYVWVKRFHLPTAEKVNGRAGTS